MKKPAQRVGTGGLSEFVDLQADGYGYAPNHSALQVHRLIRRGLTPAVAATVAAHAFAVPETWRSAQ